MLMSLVPATANDVDAIALRNLSKRFREGRLPSLFGHSDEGVLAVDDLSLDVIEGQIFGLIGPNGAGKTTVLRMLLGLVHPSKGESYIFGEKMRSGSRVLRRVGALVETPGFVPHMSGMENLRAYWQAGGDRWEDANIGPALEIAGLGTAINRKVRTYSKGMQQRLALAQVLLNRPQLLILDEPTVGLDPGEMRDVRELIRRLHQEGATVFLSSHILAELEQVCTHAAVMAKGKLVATGSVEELIGGRQSIYIEVDDVEKATRVLQATPGVTRVEPEPPGVAIVLNGVARKDIVAALVHAGVGVETVATRRRLEEAFLGMMEEEEA
jgi:ABC-2 type transport system ATP-binding protein